MVSTTEAWHNEQTWIPENQALKANTDTECSARQYQDFEQKDATLSFAIEFSQAEEHTTLPRSSAWAESLPRLVAVNVNVACFKKVLNYSLRDLKVVGREKQVPPWPLTLTGIVPRAGVVLRTSAAQCIEQADEQKSKKERAKRKGSEDGRKAKRVGIRFPMHPRCRSHFGIPFQFRFQYQFQFQFPHLNWIWTSRTCQNEIERGEREREREKPRKGKGGNEEKQSKNANTKIYTTMLMKQG